ncbi:hypothetical protein [uncultured Clostridium sp.]|jgi:hypothetical protein|uniref:hypothetical protein n=1 Tax=uncultured Clostridium sp. TaxID=59620 RepID=UPI0026187A03|nr:hypothetical protein [uncultured Clostridium sp.]
MEKEILEKTEKLIQDFYDIKKILIGSKLENLNINKERIIVSEDCFSERWEIYNLDIFINKSIEEDLLDLDFELHIDKDIPLLNSDEWLKKYGSKLYAEKKVEIIKKEFISLNKLWNEIISEKYILVLKKNFFDIEKFLEDIVGKSNFKIDDENLVISKVEGELLKQGNDKSKIVKELTWTKNNMENSSIEVILPIERRHLNKENKIRCIKIKFSGEYIKFNIVNYYNNGNIQVIDTKGTGEWEFKMFLLKYKLSLF